MSDNDIPNPGLGPLVSVLITVVRFGVALVAGWLITQLARVGIEIDSTKMQMALWGLLALLWVSVARLLEERGHKTRMLGIKQPPKYDPKGPK